MSQDESIIGLTLTELALLVLVVVLVVSSLRVLAATTTQPSAEELANSVSSLTEELAEASAEIARQKAELDQLALDLHAKAKELSITQVRLNQARASADLRSTRPPVCSEAQYGGRPSLFSVIVLGDNLFEVDGEALGIKGLLSRYSTGLSAAQEEGCVPWIHTRHAASLSATEYDAGLQALERHFYLRKHGPTR